MTECETDDQPNAICCLLGYMLNEISATLHNLMHFATQAKAKAKLED